MTEAMFWVHLLVVAAADMFLQIDAAISRPLQTTFPGSSRRHNTPTPLTVRMMTTEMTALIDLAVLKTTITPVTISTSELYDVLLISFHRNLPEPG